MKKLSLSNLFESIFSPELPSGRNSHMFRKSQEKGPKLFPYNHAEETLDDEVIDKELQLEFKTGRTMRDPANLSTHNLHNGSFANGKASKSFGSYQLNSAGDNDPSIYDAEARSISVENPEKNGDIPDDWKPYFESQKRSFSQAEAAKPKKRKEMTLWDAFRAPKIQKEAVGQREKGRAYGAPISTKNPLTSGTAKATSLEFLSDDEIDKELGLKEWMSSSPIIKKRLHSPDADLNFFEEPLNKYQMNTEEDFDKNQKKRKNEKKRRIK